jgi:low-affinity ferrous iron transport protein
MGRICAHELMVLAGVTLTICLIIGSSAMKWNVTGQLISNVPPSIVETFFMMILITGHNVGDNQSRSDFQNIYNRRLKLLAFVEAMEAEASQSDRGSR